MKPSEKIEKLLENMNVTSDPEKDQQTLDTILQAQAETKKQTPTELRPDRWRIILKKPITKYAATGLIVISGLLSLTFIDRIAFFKKHLHDRVNREYQIEMKQLK